MRKPQYAPIMSAALSRTLWESGVRPNYVLLLANEIVAHPQEYGELYKQRSRSDVVILDNGMPERGEPLPPDMLAWATETVRPTYLVLPDYKHDPARTAEASIAASRQWEGPMQDLDVKFMGVPQGRTLEEYTTCADQLVDQAHVSALAVSKFAEENFRTRNVLVGICGSFGVPIHLLGFTNDLSDDVYCVGLPHVMGIDSAMPIWYGQRNKLLPPHPPKHNEFGRRPQDFMSRAELTTAVLANIFIVQTWLDRETSRGDELTRGHKAEETSR